MANKVKWENADFKWEKAPTTDEAARYTWNDVLEIILELETAVVAGSGIIEPAVKALAPEKKKKLIRLIMHRKGVKVYDESKEIKSIEVHIEDIKTIIEEAKVRMQIENIQL
tara:strand:+ start:934 stop:1269 length:336 start_codon:yes stop_codon:yes gene_type:complete